MTIYGKLEELLEDHQRSLWGTQEFYRVFSGVNGGRSSICAAGPEAGARV